MAAQSSGMTLTQATEMSRMALKVGVLFLVLFFVSRFAFNAFVAYWKAMNPPPPPPPTVGFGVLPSPLFPLRSDLTKPTQYVLETPTGQFPTFPDRALVYFMPKNAPSLLDHERAVTLANTLGFVFEPEIVDSQTYRWQKTEPILTTLQLNIHDLVYSYSTDYLNRPELFINKSIPSKFDAVEEVKSFLQKGIEIGDDLATASGSFSYVKAVGPELLPAVSVADADFIQVDLQRAAIADKYQVYTEFGTKGIVHALVGPQTPAGEILALDNRYFPVDYSLGHTYPLRSIRQAWDLLQSGEGYIAQSKATDQAVIREIELGYYDTTEGQEYLQPIYVFKGDNDFLGFVAAIDPTYLFAQKP